VRVIGQFATETLAVFRDLPRDVVRRDLPHGRIQRVQPDLLDLDAEFFCQHLFRHGKIAHALKRVPDPQGPGAAQRAGRHRGPREFRCSVDQTRIGVVPGHNFKRASAAAQHRGEIHHAVHAVVVHDA